MLLRLIDRPAGFVKKAFRRTFLGPKAPAVSRYRPGSEPDYWQDRFSNPDLSLQTPLPPAPPGPKTAVGLRGDESSASMRISQQGRAASTLAPET